MQAIQNVISSFTRPADITAYASGDLAANSTTAGSVTPLSFVVSDYDTGAARIMRIRISKSGTSVTNASFRVHLYGASPTCANGDNGAWSTTQSSYFGSIDVTVDKAFTDGAVGVGAAAAGAEPNIRLTGGGKTIYALVEVRAAYTPASAEIFYVTLEFWNK